MSEPGQRPDPLPDELQPQPAIEANDVSEWLRKLDAEQPEPGKREPEELNLPPQKLYEFITSDFESAWAAFGAMRPAQGRSGRGNMMFARQAMTLLEFACRLYGQDEEARRDFSAALLDIERRYFTEMPGSCGAAGRLLLPFHPDKGPESADRTLLTALYDLMRHGLAHQYQNITVELTDRRVFAIGVSGANYGDVLGDNKFRDNYLSYLKADHNDLVLRLYPDYLYLDVKEAITRASLLDRGLALAYFARGGDRQTTYQFDAATLEAALRVSGHARVMGHPGR